MLCYLCVCVFSSSLNRKQSRRRNEKLLPPLLSPLSDDPPRKRACESSSSLSQEGGTTGILPCSTTSTPSSSSHRHRRGEGKVSSHARNGSVSAFCISPFWVHSCSHTHRLAGQLKWLPGRLFAVRHHCSYLRIQSFWGTVGLGCYLLKFLAWYCSRSNSCVNDVLFLNCMNLQQWHRHPVIWVMLSYGISGVKVTKISKSALCTVGGNASKAAGRINKAVPSIKNSTH